MTIEELEQQALLKKMEGLNNHSLHSPGQSDTVNGVTVFADWKPDGRRKGGGSYRFSYMAGAWANCSKVMAISFYKTGTHFDQTI